MRITSSSAVLRELTIQAWSRYRRKTSTAVPRGTRAGRRAQAPRGAAERLGCAGSRREAWPARGCSRRSARGPPRPPRAGPAPRPAPARAGAAGPPAAARPVIRATGSRTWRNAEAKAATRTVPAGGAAGSRSRRAASIAARMVTACPASRRPAGVSRTRRPSGSISAVPASRASAAICCETVEVVTCIASPTSRIEPRRDSSSSSSRRRGSTSKSFIIHERYVHRISRGHGRFALVSTGNHDRQRRIGPGRDLDGRGLDDPASRSAWRCPSRCSARSARWARSGSGWPGPP